MSDLSLPYFYSGSIIWFLRPDRGSLVAISMS